MSPYLHNYPKEEIRFEIYLLGSGGHARVVRETWERMGGKVTAVLEKPGVETTSFDGLPVISETHWSPNSPVGDTCGLLNGVGLVGGDLNARKMVFRTHLPTTPFPPLKHPSASVAKDFFAVDGVQIHAGVILQPGVIAGLNTVFNTGARIDHDSYIGEHTFIGPGAILCGGVIVGREVLIGAGAIILPGIKIGDGAVVGAGSVVTRPVPEHTVVWGNPARQRRKEP